VRSIGIDRSLDAEEKTGMTEEPHAREAPPSLRGAMDRRETVHLDELEWQPSPGGEVLRKRLHRVGPAEAGQVTSLVRYPPGSRFPAHDHPEGEEIFVLEGIFSDQQGDFPAGTHLLNPEGFRHAPTSKPGCLLFVKLRQYAGEGREHRVTQTADLPFVPDPHDPIETLTLYREPGFPDVTCLEVWPKQTDAIERVDPGGAEILVYAGALEDDEGLHPAPSWLRIPPGSRHRAWSREGCRLYRKSGALASLRQDGDR
jgi:anti-sigma factor ChrR (cupin superfamily)